MKQNNKDTISNDGNCQGSLELLHKMRATGAIHNPAIRGLWQIGNCQLASGKYAAKAQAQIDRIVTPMHLAQQFAPPKPPRIPRVPAGCGILIGTEVAAPHRKVFININGLVRHGLIVGQNGTGKSRLMLSIVDQIMMKNLAVGR